MSEYTASTGQASWPDAHWLHRALPRRGLWKRLLCYGVGHRWVLYSWADGLEAAPCYYCCKRCRTFYIRAPLEPSL